MLFAASEENGVRLSSSRSAPDTLQVARADRNDFRPAPLEPSWILENNPVAQSLPLVCSRDGGFTCGKWECTAGKFEFHYACDEVIYILEGSAIIEDSCGTRTIYSGDVVLFPQGTSATWTIDTYVKKLAIFRVNKGSLPRRIARRLWRLIKSTLGRQ